LRLVISHMQKLTYKFSKFKSLCLGVQQAKLSWKRENLSLVMIAYKSLPNISETIKTNKWPLMSITKKQKRFVTFNSFPISNGVAKECSDAMFSMEFSTRFLADAGNSGQKMI